MHNDWAPLKDCEKGLLALSCLSILQHGTTQLPMLGFSRHLIFEYFSMTTRKQQKEKEKKIIIFRKSVEKIQVSLKSGKNNAY